MKNDAFAFHSEHYRTWFTCLKAKASPEAMLGAAAAGGRKCKQGAFINSIHFDVGGKLSLAHHFLVSSFILLTMFNPRNFYCIYREHFLRKMWNTIREFLN